MLWATGKVYTGFMFVLCNVLTQCSRITPWVTNMGFQNAFLVAAFAGMAEVLTFLIFVKWGKQLRKASAHRYSGYVKEMTAAGLIH